MEGRGEKQRGEGGKVEGQSPADLICVKSRFSLLMKATPRSSGGASERDAAKPLHASRGRYISERQAFTVAYAMHTESLCERFTE